MAIAVTQNTFQLNVVSAEGTLYSGPRMAWPSLAQMVNSDSPGPLSADQQDQTGCGAYCW